MSRIPLSIHIDDVSAMARQLRSRLEDYDRVPGHVEMLNLLAKAGGYKNFQHLKAEQDAVPPVEQNEANAPSAQAEVGLNLKRVRKTAGYFDPGGRLTTWPGKYNLRLLCIWVLWSRLPAKAALSELEINEVLSLNHTFNDHALLRRFLVDHELVSRTADGREYRRIEARPPEEALEVFKLVR